MVLGVQCGTRGYFGELLGTGATGSYRGVHGGTGKYFRFFKIFVGKNRSFSIITIVFTKLTILPFSERSISNSFF